MESTMEEAFGPFMLTAGMYASAPATLVPPTRSEQLFNFFYDPGGWPRVRPGSLFFARAGAGVVQGLHYHTFESAGTNPVVAAVCSRGYGHVVGNADPAGDPAAGTQTVFAPDLSHGHATVAFNADPADRFTFASLFNRCYVAGSSLDPYARWYDYASRTFGKVTAIRARGVVGYRGRNYYFGDPANPSFLYPSNADDPETVNPALALQVGTSSAEILRAIEAGGGLVLLTTRGLHYYTGFDVEHGDLELDTPDPQRAIAGPLAADLANDGYVYGYDPGSGPFRWKRGMDVADDGFAEPLRSIFQRLQGLVQSPAQIVVHFDPVYRGVHFLLPTGQDGTPNYQASFFPDVGDGGAWTHSATTTSTDVVGAAQQEDGSTLYTGESGVEVLLLAGVGEPMATAMLSYRDPVTRRAQTIAGDESGYVWRWSGNCPLDKARGDGARPGYPYVALWRSGTFHLGDVMSEGMLHRLRLMLQIRTNYDVQLRVERNHERIFRLTHTLARVETEGALDDDWILNESLLARFDPRIVRERVGMWRKAKGAQLRFELQTASAVAIERIEGTFSRTAI